MEKKRARQDKAPQDGLRLPSAASDIYPKNRGKAFELICNSLKSYSTLTTDEAALFEGNSLDLLAKIPDSSIDLILTDPPYHSTKKENIYGDADFGHDDEYREWIRKYTVEFRRILKPNGSAYLFCSSDMAPYLYVDMSRLMNMLGLITWTKPNEPGYDGWKQKMRKTSLRRWYPHTERIIFCAPALDGNLKRSPLGVFLKACRERAGLSSKQLTQVIGAFGKVNNGGAVSNWETGRNIPSRDQYARMCKAFISTKKISFMPAYEDVVRAFHVDASMPFIDAWDFKTVRQYKGKHPAEKPAELLHHIIRTSSYEGDVVLDCFAGSGSTLLSAISCNRRTIGIEIEHNWAEYSARRLTKHYSEGGLKIPKIRQKVNDKDVLPLFSV